MNYLAHLFLADNTPDAQLGNFLGDFVKGPLEQHRARYRPEVLQGIQHHRWIDQFTDRHPCHTQSRDRIRPQLRRFSGVAVDIYYDHFLACHWKRFHVEPRPVFVAKIYTILTAHTTDFPPHLQSMIPHIVAEDWLNGYASLTEMKRTFERLARRVQRENPLAQGSAILQQHYGALEADFLDFFPDLITYGRSLHQSN